MNERIKKLLDQATVDAIDATKDAVDFLDNPVTKQQRQLQLEKFAELIVRECIGCCEQVISDSVPESVDTWLNGGSQCMAEIKEHFGVE